MSSTKKTLSKRTYSRVGGTKLSKKSLFKPWMALPTIMAVLILANVVVRFVEASSCRYNYCWSPKQFVVSPASSVVQNNGVTYWDSSKSKVNTTVGTKSAIVWSSISRGQYYCFSAWSQFGATLEWGYSGWGYRNGSKYFPAKNGIVKGCIYIASKPKDTPPRWVGVSTTPNKTVWLLSIFRSDKKIY